MKITENFTLEELYRSSEAEKKHLNNVPSALEIKQLDLLAKTILQPIRNRCGFPVWVSSGYRSAAVNKAVGGSATSQHCRGQAADIKACKGHTNKELFDCIKKMVERGEIVVGQLINEYNYSWIHVSLPYNTKKNEILDAVKVGGRVTYKRH